MLAAPSLPPRPRLLGLLALSCLALGAAQVRAAGELDEAKAFLAAQPELQHLAARAVTSVGPGLYQAKLGDQSPLQLYLVKSGGGWAAALLGKDRSRLHLDAVIPRSVGDLQIKHAVTLLARGPLTLDPSTLPASELATALQAPGHPIGLAAGATLVAQLTVGESGALGLLRRGGLLPGDPLVLSGAVGRALADAQLAEGGDGPAVPSVDRGLTLALQVPSYVPAPFAKLSNPKLTLGAAIYQLSRASGALVLSGSLPGSTLQLPGRTITFEKVQVLFSQSGDEWTAKVDGSAQVGWDKAFSLPGHRLERVTLTGSLTKDGPAAGRRSLAGLSLDLGVEGTLADKPYTGALVADVEGGRVKELSLTLGGTVDLGRFGLSELHGLSLADAALGVRNADGLGYLAGTVQYRGLSGGAALLLGEKTSALFLRAKGLDLGALMGHGKLLQRVPKLEALLVLGRAAAAQTAVGDLPLPVQQMVGEVAGASTTQLQLATGVTLVTQLDAKGLGFDRVSVPGPLVVSGALDFETRQFELDAQLGKMPDVSNLPKGFIVESPQFMLAVKKTDLGHELQLGLRLSMKANLGGQELTIDTRALLDSQGSLVFVGALTSDWVNPLGLQGITLKAPLAVSLAASADGSADLGFQAGARIDNQEFNPVALCLNIQAAAPAPVTRKLGIHFKATALSPATELLLVESLLRSAVEGPLKKGIPDARFRKALAKVDTGAGKISRAAEKLPLPELLDAELYLATPDLKCELPAFTGMGAQLSGELSLMNKSLGKFESKVSMEDGLTIQGQIHPFKLLELVELREATIDLQAPMPSSAGAAAAAHLYFDGKVKLLFFDGKVHVVVDKQQVSFDVATDVADLGAVELWVKSVGGGLSGSDLQLGLKTQGTAEAALFKKLATALQAAAAESRAAAQKEQAAHQKAMEDAARDYDQLDQTVGAEVRREEQKVKDAEAALERENGKIEAAKKKCKKKGLGGLCDVTDAAKESVKAAEKSLDAARKSEEALRKSERFANLMAKKASLDTLKAEHLVAQKSLAACDDLDKVAAKAATGAAHDLLQIEQLTLEGSVKKASGKLSVTFKTGDARVSEQFQVDLAQRAALELLPAARKIAEEFKKRALK